MKERQRVKNLSGKLNDDDRRHLANFLLKAGYAVHIGKERVGAKGRITYFVEYWEEKDE